MTEADLGASSAADLTDTIEQLHGPQLRRDAPDAQCRCRVRPPGAWEHDGCGSMVDWVGARLGTTTAHATEIVAVALALEGLPMLAETFALGLIGWDKLVLAIELADTTPTPKSPPTLASSRSRISGTWSGGADRSRPATPRTRTAAGASGGGEWGRAGSAWVGVSRRVRVRS